MADAPAAPKLARLEARVGAFEAPRVWSRELQPIQRHCSPRDLVLVARIRAGLPPQPRYASEPALWQETTERTPGEEEPVLLDRWGSPGPLEHDDGASCADITPLS